MTSRTDRSTHVFVPREPTLDMIEIGINALVSSEARKNSRLSDEYVVCAIFNDMMLAGQVFDGRDQDGKPLSQAQIDRWKSEGKLDKDWVMPT